MDVAAGTASTESTDRLSEAVAIAERLTAGIETVLRGKREELRLVLTAVACGGHVLFEDVPGTGKTVLARAIARCIEDAAFSRVQCTPDLQPSDVTGVAVYNQKTRDFEFRRGPVFANVVLVDEINRAMPKTQSALLEAMAERQITVDGTTHPLPKPFLVLATENPIEFEGVFPLPEAQLDRFFLKARLGYPSADDELLVIRDQRGGHPLERLRPALAVADLERLQAAIDDVYLDELIERWIVDLVRATRELDQVLIGASVRGSLALERAARGWALLHGRGYVVPEDVLALFAPVLGHRMVLSPTFLAETRGRAQRRAAPDPRPALSRARTAPRAQARARGAVSTQLTFPLVPRWKPVGSPFGRLHASRRGLGSSVAGSRPYRPGDNPAAIDWKTSARLSSFGTEPEFVVREHFADEAPRVVVVADRRPSMALYPEPWLSKPGALKTVWKLVASAAVGELGLAGYLDTGQGTRPAWFSPSAGPGLEQVEERLAEAPFGASEDSLDEAFRHLVDIRRSLPAGTFVFVCSDYFSAPEPAWWARALAYRWDVVPVIVQDPVWEQSFPLIEPLVVSFAEPVSGRTHTVRLRRGEAEVRRRANEARLALLLSELRALSLEPMVIGSAAEPDVLQALTGWGEMRLAVRRGEW